MELTTMRSYLEETTLHGLRYLLPRRGRSCLERAIWAIAIVACLITFSYMVRTSLKEVAQHPMALIFDKVAMQDVLFPAVTLQTSQRRSIAGTFQRAILNRVDLDCTAKECAPPNDDVISFLTESLQDLAEQKLSEPRRSQDFNLYELPSPCPFPLQELEAQFVKRANETGVSLWDLTVDMLQEMARRPWQNVSTIIEKFADAAQQNSFSSCEEAINSLTEIKEEMTSLFWILGDYSALEAYYMLPLRLGNFLYLTGLEALETEELDYYGRAGMLRPRELPKDLFRSLEKATEAALAPPEWSSGPANGPTVGDAMRMLVVGLTDLSKKGSFQFLPANNTDGVVGGDDDGQVFESALLRRCNDLYKAMYIASEERETCTVLSNGTPLRALLKVLKHTIIPLGRDSFDTEVDEAELHKALTILKNDGFTLTRRAEDHPRSNLHPLVMGCGLGEEDRSRTDCSSWFRPTRTTQGIGFVFNAADFWDVHSDTDSNRAFYEAFFAAGAEYKPPVYVQANGPGFSLRLRVSVPDFDDDKAQPVFLAVHDPSVPANPDATSSIRLKSGVEYTVKVSVSRSTMDRCLVEATDEKDRRCRPEYDIMESSNFKSYSQNGCLLECLVREAAETCKCVPWDFVHLGLSNTTCHADTTFDCFRLIMSRAGLYNTVLHCNCPSSCTATKYALSTSSAPVRSTSREEEEQYDYYELVRCQGDLSPLLRSSSLGDVAEGEFGNPCIDGPDVAVVNVYVTNDEVTVIHKILRVSLADQLANFGGVMGLFTGMSLLSLVELVMWLLRWAYDATCQRVCRRRVRNIV